VSLGGNDAVPHDLGCSEVGRSGGQFVGMVEEVATGGDVDLVGIFLLRAVVNDDARVCDGVDGRNVGYLVKVHKLDGVRTLGVLVSLGNSTKLDANGFHPSFT